MKTYAILLRFIFLATLISGVVTCTFPITNLPQSANYQYLVIDANISDSFSEVRLSLSSENARNFNNYPVKYAKVYLSDVNNKTYPLNEKDNGYYNANQILQPGLLYQLHIIKEDGEQYESLPEIMPQVPSIDTLFYRFEQKPNFPEGNENRNGFNVYVHFKDSEKDGEYYQWAWKHYERARYCNSYIDIDGSETYIYCESNCWDLKINKKQILLTDELKNGKQLEMLVERIPYYSSPQKYYLMVEQRGITKNAYTYFSSLKSQNETNGTPFDIPPQTRFSVNIHSVSNPDEKIIGIFNLFSSRKKLIYINRNIVGISPLTLPYLKFCAAPCEAPCIESNTQTKVKPVGWED
jgi:hypothetical protein